MTFPWRSTTAYARVRMRSWEPNPPLLLFTDFSSKTRKKQSNPDELIDYQLKNTPTGRKLMTWSWTNAVQMQKKKRSKKRMSWNGKNETARKSLVSWKLSIIQRLVDWETRKLDTYSCKYINFGRSKTQAFFKNMEKFTFCRSLDQVVRWVMGSFEFLTRDYFFCSLTELAWCELPGWYRSMIVMVVLVPERQSLSQMLYLKLNVLSCLGCFWRHFLQKWTKLSHGAPVSAPFPDFGLVISMMKNWFT